MCAQFIIQTKVEEIPKKLGHRIILPQLKDPINLRVKGFLKTEKAPVVVSINGTWQMKEMAYSLCPTWSKEFPFASSTYNARMERVSPKNPLKNEKIYEVPTWRDSFIKGNTCLVPMTAAIESSYFGNYAGKMMQLKVKNNELFFVVGLWSSWLDKATGEIKDTFALITDNPYEFFFQCGHDRSVLVIHPQSYKDWLENKSLKPQDRFDLIRNHRINLEWDTSVDREMAKGWEKRKPTEEEISHVSVWHESH